MLLRKSDVIAYVHGCITRTLRTLFYSATPDTCVCVCVFV